MSGNLLRDIRAAAERALALRDADIAELRAMIAELRDRVAAVEAKRGPGRPRKTAVGDRCASDE